MPDCIIMSFPLTLSTDAASRQQDLIISKRQCAALDCTWASLRHCSACWNLHMPWHQYRSPLEGQVTRLRPILRCPHGPLLSPHCSSAAKCQALSAEAMRYLCSMLNADLMLMHTHDNWNWLPGNKCRLPVAAGCDRGPGIDLTPMHSCIYCCT